MLVKLSTWKHNRKVKSLKKSIDRLNQELETFANYVKEFLECAASEGEFASMFQLKVLHCHEQVYKRIVEGGITHHLYMQEWFERRAIFFAALQPPMLEELDFLERLKKSEIEAWQDRAHTTALKKIEDGKVGGGMIPKVKCCISL